jgi:hypothetical protein
MFFWHLTKFSLTKKFGNSHNIFITKKISIKIHKYMLKLIYYKYNMSALHQKSKNTQKKKKNSKTALYTDF